MLGIIGAMGEEVAMVRAQSTDVRVEPRAVMDFYKGKLEGKEAVVVCSGINKINAAMCTQILANIYGVTDMVNIGIVGSLEAEIDIGDIVLSSGALQHDTDVAGFDYEPGQIPRVETLVFKTDEGLIDLAEGCCPEVDPGIRTFVGRVVIGDQFISDKGEKKWLTDTFGGYYIEMEGAAIAQTCYLSSIPFPIVRAISDKADDSASVDYPAFEAKAIVHSVNLLIETICSLR